MTYTGFSTCRPICFLGAIALICLPGLTGKLRADEPEPVPRFRMLSVVGSIHGLQYAPSGTAAPVPLAITTNPHRFYPIPQGGTLEIFRLLPVPPGAPPETQPERVVVATGRIPPDTVRALVVLGRSERGEVSLVILDDDPAKHPPGQIRLINLSGMHAAVGLNKQKSLLAPGESDLVDWGTGGILIQIAAKKEGEWKVAYRRERIAQPSSRAYGLIFNYVHDPSMSEDPTNLPPATIRLFSEYVRSTE